MKVENPAALRFILEDDLYLLNNEKALYISNDLTPDPVEVIQPVIETPAISFNYMGGLKGFLILVNYPQHEFIDDAHLTALENILKRKELVIDDVSIFNIAKYNDVSYASLTSFFNPMKLLVLGKDALPGDLQTLVLNKPGKVDNCMALYSFSFDEMMTNNEYKKSFWEQMKTL